MDAGCEEVDQEQPRRTALSNHHCIFDTPCGSTTMTWTQLHEECERQNFHNVIDLAHKNPEHVLRVDDHGSNPLHILCWGNPDPKAVESLLEACPQIVTDQDFHGDTPLHIACSCSSTDRHIVQMLIDACPTAASIPNREGLLPLHMACRHAPENEAIIGLLIETFPYALLHRIKMGSPAPRTRVNPLAPKPTDHMTFDPALNVQDSVDLRYQGHGTQLRDGAYPLHMAVIAGASVGVLELLIKEAPDVLLLTNKLGETPLHLALQQTRNEDVVELLLRCEPKAIRVRDKHGDLPIHVAARSGCSIHIGKDLLELWPESIHETNGSSLTPMVLAIQHGNCSDDVLRLLEITDHES